ncbi:MAG: universal stress protein [Methanotrichaceae archaeon]
MFKKVLVPIDFSRYSQKVLECVGEIPGLTEIVLLHVVARGPLMRFWDPVAEVRDAERKLAEETRRIKLPNVGVKTRATFAVGGAGDVVGSTINKIADEENADLIIMGARGRSLIGSDILGSSSRGVLRYGDRNLLIMRYKLLGDMEKGSLEKYCARIFSRVLVPTDLSEPSEAATSLIKNISGIGEIILLYVVSRGETKGEIDTATTSATEKLNEIASAWKQGNVAVTPKAVVGNAIEEIRRVADELDVSLIAMSSQGATALKTGRIGSTAYDVANSSDRPVLILRPGRTISS